MVHINFWVVFFFSFVYGSEYQSRASHARQVLSCWALSLGNLIFECVSWLTFLCFIAVLLSGGHTCLVVMLTLLGLWHIWLGAHTLVQSFIPLVWCCMNVKCSFSYVAQLHFKYNVLWTHHCSFCNHLAQDRDQFGIEFMASCLQDKSYWIITQALIVVTFIFPAELFLHCALAPFCHFVLGIESWHPQAMHELAALWAISLANVDF